MVTDEAGEVRVEIIVIASLAALPLLLDGNYATSEALALLAFHRYRGVPLRCDPWPRLAPGPRGMCRLNPRALDTREIFHRARSI